MLMCFSLSFLLLQCAQSDVGSGHVRIQENAATLSAWAAAPRQTVQQPAPPASTTPMKAAVWSIALRAHTYSRAGAALP